MTLHQKRLYAYAQCWRESIFRREAIKLLREQGWENDPSSLTTDPWMLKPNHEGNMPLSLLLQDNKIQAEVVHRVNHQGFLDSQRPIRVEWQKK